MEEKEFINIEMKKSTIVYFVISIVMPVACFIYDMFFFFYTPAFEGQNLGIWFAICMVLSLIGLCAGFFSLKAQNKTGIFDKICVLGLTISACALLFTIFIFINFADVFLL